MKRLNILLLCDYHDGVAATVRDHIVALETYSRHKWWRLSMLGDLPDGLDLDRFDAVVVHYTLVASSNSYVSESARERLAGFRGLKAIFIQDEYRFVDKSTDAMRQIGIHILFTCVPSAEIDNVYAAARLPGVTKRNVLTGYVPEKLLDWPVQLPSQRQIDIGYRGRNVPAWLGELGQEKIQIGVRVRDEAPAYGLNVDISFREEDRLYGDAWIKFVSSCKGMLGVESGSSVVDFTGEIQRNVERHVSSKPGTGFAELRERYFATAEGKINFAQISPRCFEAAALRTLMILYEGEYSGVLVPWRHYVPLKKDHSNLAEVVAVLRDASRLDQIVMQAYDEIAKNPKWSFAQSVADVDAVIDGVFVETMASRKKPYSSEEFLRHRLTFQTVRRRAQRVIIGGAVWVIFRGILGRLDPVRRQWVHGWLRKIFDIVTFREWRRNRAQ